MGKRLNLILIILSLSLILSACSAVPTTQSTVPTETTLPAATEAPAETTVPPETTAPPESEVPTTVLTTEPAVTESNTVPYIQSIDRPDQSIYAGPSYDYAFVATVRKAGTYTIVEEVWDNEGNLWGRLKSGIGWVDLTEIRSPEYAESLISANYADEYLLLHGAYHYCPCQDTEYYSTIAFRAYGVLRDVEIFAYEWRNDEFVPGEPFFRLPEFTPDMPLVAELSFPGDMSTCGIRFVDESGVTHCYSIYISGRNGQLILTKE